MAGPVSALRRVGKSIADQVAELVRLGYPESTAKKIASGEFPMDQASRMARAREQGKTTEAYSGSTHDIAAFDGSRANPENDFGRGSYATTSQVDAGDNYAGVGPDLTNRIQSRAERLADDLAEADEWNLEETLASIGKTRADYEADEAGIVEMLAKQELVGEAGEGVVYPLRINTEKYARIGGDNPTYIENSRDYFAEARDQLGDAADEDDLYELADELQANDEDGLYARIANALQDTEIYQDEAAQQAVMEAIQDDVYSGAVRAQDLDDAIRNADMMAYDEATGEYVSAGEISRQVLQNLGFEGVIDNTVDLKFGSNRRGFMGAKIPGMSGVNPDTSHIITFPGKEQNIRSVNAAFDPDQAGNPNLLAGSAAAAVGLGAASQSEDADAGVVTRGGKRLIEAFHGSPHKFDRFSMENIGTGEGAQAYGHGLYFADSEDVARGYRDNLSAQPTVKMATDGDPEEWAAHLVKMHGGEDQAMLTLAGVDGDRLTRPHRVAAYEAIKSGAYKKFKVNDGSLYKVDIDVDPDTLLDWDKPLSEQSEAVRRAFEPITESLRKISPDADPSGETLWRMAEGGRFLREGDEFVVGGNEAARRLREAGIPGIRYLDGDSRRSVTSWDDASDPESYHELAKGVAENYLESSSNNVGEAISKLRRDAAASGAQQYVDAANALESGALKPSATYNYVMFDDKPISIRERGMVTPEMAATMAAGGAAGVAATQDTPAWMQSAMQNIAPEEEAEIDRRITQRLRGAQYRKRSRQREDRYAGIRESLLSGVTAIDRTIGNAFQAIEMPYQGYLGLTRAAGGLMAGESPQQALMQGAQDARQPIDQTAYDMGGAVTDATGSPMAGAVVNTAVNMGGF